MVSGKLRIQPFHAFWTDAVRKLSFGMIPYITNGVSHLQTR